MNLISATLGFVLGAWLIVAGVQKLLSPMGLQPTLAQLLGPASNLTVIRSVARVIPWLEVSVGVSACLFPDALVSRIAVLLLFTSFLVTISILAIQYAEFDCGCFGTAGQREPRRAILARGLVALLTAGVYFAVPSVGPMTSSERLWLQCAGWSLFAVGLAVSQAREFGRINFEDR